MFGALISNSNSASDPGYGGFLQGVPQNGWFIINGKKAYEKWMIWGSPILGSIYI
jgi:hypothetical protein